LTKGGGDFVKGSGEIAGGTAEFAQGAVQFAIGTVPFASWTTGSDVFRVFLAKTSEVVDQAASPPVKGCAAFEGGCGGVCKPTAALAPHSAANPHGTFAFERG
jgi:hypothetical protein